MVSTSYVLALQAVSMRDVARVGGKNASLGELLQRLSQAGVRAVGGFATEVSAYAAFLAANDLTRVIESAMTAYAAVSYTPKSEPAQKMGTIKVTANTRVSVGPKHKSHDGDEAEAKVEDPNKIHLSFNRTSASSFFISVRS